jgi:hypothetical protein
MVLPRYVASAVAAAVAVGSPGPRVPSLHGQFPSTCSRKEGVMGLPSTQLKLLRIEAWYKLTLLIEDHDTRLHEFGADSNDFRRIFRSWLLRENFRSAGHKEEERCKNEMS